MKDWQTLLNEGVDTLRREDEEINRLFSARGGEIISLLERYAQEILFFNQAYGIVGTNDPQELATKHILDSLAPLGIISRLLADSCADDSKPQIAHAGSGAGLPGIPLAIALPDFCFTLIERMSRRAGFLLHAQAVLGLSNVTVEEGEAEKTGGSFALVTFRAFKPLEPKLLASLFKICSKGGVIAAYKGKREKIEQEMKPLEKLCGKWEALPCRVPFLNEKRHLLVIKPQ